MNAVSIILLLFSWAYPFPASGDRTQATTQDTKSSAQPMMLPACAAVPSGMKRIGWGKSGLQFDAPRRDVEILGGKPDVDYVPYVIKPKKQEAYLELWFGPYAFSAEPEKELVATSVKTQKRDVVGSLGVAGVDYSGTLPTGEVWRHTFILVGGADGARYKTTAENAALFDHIINSACVAP